MKAILLISFLVLISFASAQGALSCQKCASIEKNCQAFCSGQQDIPKRIACIEKCAVKKQQCIGKCQEYNKCRENRKRVSKECKALKKSGKKYVQNIKKMYGDYQNHRKNNKEQEATKITGEQQKHLTQAKEYATKFYQCKEKLSRMKKCRKPCASIECIEKRKCHTSCGGLYKLCKKGCKRFKGQANTTCVEGCYKQKMTCKKVCTEKRCGRSCKQQVQCQTKCQTKYLTQVQSSCKKSISPQCHQQCTGKCNKKCNTRDNEGCLRACAFACNYGCHNKAGDKCIKRNKIVMKDCKKICKLLPPPKPIQKVFDHKCGAECAAFHTSKVSTCSKRPFTCTFPCYKKCRTPSCTSPQCLSQCVGPCSKKCLWSERKTCHFKYEKITSKCLKGCAGWNLKSEMSILDGLRKKHVGKRFRCKAGCKDQVRFDKTQCFASQKGKCPTKCSKICVRSKCKTESCRIRCSKKCGNQCFSLLRKKCTLLANSRAQVCLNGCK